MIKERIADNLRRLRKKAGKKQREVAAGINVSKRTYEGYEAGRTPPFDILLRIANFHQVSVDDLLSNYANTA